MNGEQKEYALKETEYVNPPKQPYFKPEKELYDLRAHDPELIPKLNTLDMKSTL